MVHFFCYTLYLPKTVLAVIHIKLQSPGVRADMKLNIHCIILLDNNAEPFRFDMIK